MNKIFIKNKHLFWVFALFAGFALDQLFWDKPGGINFFIFILLAVLGGLVLNWMENITIPWSSYLLLLPITAYAAFTFIRSEPITTLMNGLLTIGSMVLLTITLQNGRWLKYTFIDHIVNLFHFALNALIGGILFFVKTRSKRVQPSDTVNNDVPKESPKENKPPKPWMAYLRGVLIALPIVLLLALLLGSADPVFGSRLLGIFDWLSFEHLGELIIRLVYTLAVAYLLLSAYFFGLAKSGDLPKRSQNAEGDKTFLGMVESNIILGAVNLLFLGFVLIQFTYLFGGDQNISIEGYTYAEYARRGFFELLAVAVISGCLFTALSWVTARKTKTQRWVFTGLGLLLVGLVGIILFSALTRLTLYEAAYGFTRLRTFTHVFIFWMGGMLAALAALEVTQMMKRLPLVLILMLMTFGVAINSLNVDRFIVRQNVQRAVLAQDKDGENRLDTAYLSELSFDSIPPLRAHFLDGELPETLRREIGGVLACRLESLEVPERIPLTSWHAARSKAVAQLHSLADELSDYRVYFSEDPWGWFVEVNGETYPCNLPWD